MEIKLDTNADNLGYRTNAQDDDNGSYHAEDCGASLSIAVDQTSLQVAITINHYLQMDNSIKVEDLTFSIPNKSVKYLHSFLTTFLKLHPREE